MHLSTSSIVLARSQDLIRDLWFFMIFVFFMCFFEKSIKKHKICPKSDFCSPLRGSSLADKTIVSMDENRTYGMKIVPMDENRTFGRKSCPRTKINVLISIISVFWALPPRESVSYACMVMFSTRGVRFWWSRGLKTGWKVRKTDFWLNFEICWMGRRHARSV